VVDMVYFVDLVFVVSNCFDNYFDNFFLADHTEVVVFVGLTYWSLIG